MQTFILFETCGHVTMKVAAWKKLYFWTPENRWFSKNRSYLSWFWCHHLGLREQNVSYDITKLMAIGWTTKICSHIPQQKSDIFGKCRLRHIRAENWQSSGKFFRIKFCSLIGHSKSFIFFCLPWVGIGRRSHLFYQKLNFYNRVRNSNIYFGAKTHSNIGIVYAFLKNLRRRI